MRAVHIFSTDDIDGKFASSIAYEYFRRYREDVDKYFFHDIKNNTLDAKPHSDDCVVIIKYRMHDEESAEVVMNLVKEMHEVLLFDIGENIDLTEELKYLSLHNSNFTCVREYCGSIAYLTYNHFWKLIHGCGAALLIPNFAFLDLLNDYAYLRFGNGDGPYDSLEYFMYGLESMDITSKNAIRTIFNHNYGYDIFKLEKDNSISLGFVADMINIGEYIDNYHTTKHLTDARENGHVFDVDNIIDGGYFLGYAVNTTCPPYAFNRILSVFDLLCLYRKNGDNIWEYHLYSREDDVNCSKIAKYLNKHSNIGESTSYHAVFFSNTCLFDCGNEFIIKRKLLSKDHKVLIAHNGDMKSILY